MHKNGKICKFVTEEKEKEKNEQLRKKTLSNTQCLAYVSDDVLDELCGKRL